MADDAKIDNLAI